MLTQTPFAVSVEAFFARNAKTLFIISMVCFVIVSALLFDTKIFLMGDDADYIMDGYNFIYHNTYPANRSGLYGMILGCILLLTGMQVVPLKLFSFACAVAGFFLLYKAFKEKIPYALLFAILFFMAVNNAVLYYSSSNLSEAFFMMVQAMYFHAVFLLNKKQVVYRGMRNLWPWWCYVGGAGLLLSLSKNVAVAAPLSVSLYYLLKKEYRHAGLAIAFYALFKIPYELVLRLAFEKNTMVSQMGQVLSKNLYHPEYGRESIGGFISRLYTNAGVYLSNHFINVLGLKSILSGLPSVAGWMMIVCMGYGMYIAYRKNKWMFFTGIYLFVMLGVTFLALQPQVAQERIIIIYVPLLLGLLLYSLAHLFQRLFKQKGLIITGILFLVTAGFTVAGSISAIHKNIPVLTKNLRGETFYGYTPDWINYLQMGRFVANTLPDSVGVAARKPASLTIYTGGRPFFFIGSVSEQATADELLQELSRNHIRYLIIASIRHNPNVRDGYVVNTLHRYAAVIREQYPNRVKTIMRIGEEEPCFLVQIIY